MIGRTSEASRFKLISFLRYWGCDVWIMAKVVGKRDDFVMDALFYFEPVQKFEYRGDMFSFEGSSYCASKRVLQ